MDWYVESPAQVSELRRQFREYLMRHALPGEDVDGAVLAFSELVTNAFEHGGPNAWISVDWSQARPIVTVRDLGPSFDIESLEAPSDRSPRGRGIQIASSLPADIDVASRNSGGATVTAVLSVTRPYETNIDPPRRPVHALPDETEAGPDGFGREAFLRALVVQLAQNVETVDGPAAAERLVAQVGVDVGSQMETEFRKAMDLEGVLSSEQMAECFVRLKHAIEGDFYPIEVSEQRIVLANRKCPFGTEVQRAPALCRMTSSVFGGIAARNADGASVLLEERIAVGDSQCRVVIRLGDAARPSSGEAVGHYYAQPIDG